MHFILLIPGLVLINVIDILISYDLDDGQKFIFSLVLSIIIFFLVLSRFKKEDLFDQVTTAIGAYFGLSVVIGFLSAVLYYGFKLDFVGQLFHPLLS